MDGQAQSRVGTRYAGRYDLTSVLGEGGMGAVYHARHAFTGGEVALKIMHSGVARSKNARERFLREAQAPMSIGHPGIVKVSDAGVAEDGTLYLALELLHGEDLGAAVERGGVDAASVLAITIELLDILGAAHASGLVHRDIKPENVFLCREGGAGRRVRLLDFGITRQVTTAADEKLTQTGTILGTPHYMSPEQARGQPVDARSDIYAVGGMLFYALTGRPPFNAANYNLLIVAIMTHPAPQIRSVRQEIPTDLAAVIDRALASNPDVRFASATEMRAALMSCATPNLPAVRVAPAMAYEPTTPSAGDIPVVSASSHGTPIRHPAPAHLPPGVTTQPAPARTPQSGPPPRGHIPPTMGASAVAVSAPSADAAPAKKSKTGLLVALVVMVGAVVGGGVAAAVLLPGGDTANTVSAPDAPEIAPPVVQVLSADAAMVPNMAAEAQASVEERISELEARTMAAEARAEEAERAQEEEEAARAVARRRAAMRRAEQQAQAEATRRAAVSRCRLECSTDLHECRRNGGGHGKAASDCQRAWSRCGRECDSR